MMEDALLILIFYWPGWLILRVVTFGRYPPAQSVPHNREFVAGVPLAVLPVVITLIYTI